MRRQNHRLAATGIHTDSPNQSRKSQHYESSVGNLGCVVRVRYLSRGDITMTHVCFPPQRGRDGDFWRCSCGQQWMLRDKRWMMCG